MDGRVKCATPLCEITVRARSNKTGFCVTCLRARQRATPRIPVEPLPEASPIEQVAADREKSTTGDRYTILKRKYDAALGIIERQENELGWLAQIRERTPSTYVIEPRQGSGTSEATPILVASDWHAEEVVRGAQVSGLNEFNPDIAERRITRFFQASLRLIQLLNKDVAISSVVLGLLGDFITNDIHDAENAENNALTPIQAILMVQERLIAGIEFFLNHSAYTFVIPCKVGNHSRTTKKVRAASETGHSLETLMYAHLAAYFRGEPRVQFVIDDGYHTYMNVYDTTVRFHHGHSVRYQGGVGGLFIPAYKSISAWNKARHADLDVFGHFHQMKDGGNFLCNGSLIGYNAYALCNKFDFEQPRQTLFLVDKRRGRTCTWPVLLG